MIFLPFELYQIPHMGKYFHVDQARRTCITAYPNMVTKSQMYMENHVISKKKMNKKVKGYMLRILQRFGRCFEKHSTAKKQRKHTHKDSTKTYLTTEIWHFLPAFVILKLFLPLDRSSICFEDGSLLLVLRSSSHKMLLC